MLKLIVFTVGCPGTGKDFALKRFHPYVISPDAKRLELHSPIRDSMGEWRISQEHSSLVYELILRSMKFRMTDGCFTILSSTFSNIKLIPEYEILVETFQYEARYLDFRSVPLELCLKRNQERSLYKRVPEDVVKGMYDRLSKMDMPEWMTPITIKEMERKMREAGEYIEEETQ